MKGKGAYPITKGGRVTGFRQRGNQKKEKPARRVTKRTPERRIFTVHGREYSWTKSQMKKELGVPPEDVYALWKSGQVPWRDYINSAIRHIEVGDEEEIRIPEDKEAYMKGFKQEGVSTEDLAKLDKLIDGNRFDLNYDAIRDILLKYMSHKELYENDYDNWEKRTWEDEDDDDSSAPYCPFCEDSKLEALQGATPSGHTHQCRQCGALHAPYGLD